MIMKRYTRIWMMCLLLMGIAQQAMAQRGCRPQLMSKGVPAYVSETRRAALEGSDDEQTKDSTYIGNRHQLVVLAAFSDTVFSANETETIEHWEKVLNAENFEEEPFQGSVHDYFRDQSYGQLNLNFDVHYITVDKASKYRSTARDDENSKYLVQDIVDSLKKMDIDWSLYDWNGDGYMNQLLIIYAGKGMNDGGGTNSIWPHQWWMSMHENCGPISISYNDKTYLVDSYCCVNELSNDVNGSTFGTICHEYSHCFGLPDFYNGSAKYVGEWDLMDCGNYNGKGFVPTGYSAFERMYMGWLTPEELTADTTITDMPALNDEPTAYMVRNDGHQDEYYIIENRQQTKWDSKVPGNGIVIFHVDYNKRVFLYDWVNTTSRQRYTIFAANNNPQTYISSFLAGWPYPSAAGNNALTNTSAPAAKLNNMNTDSTYLMSKPITNMAVDNGLASFDFMKKIVPEDTTQTDTTSTDIITIHTTDIKPMPSRDNTRYNLNGQHVDSHYKGLVIINRRKRLIK